MTRKRIITTVIFLFAIAAAIAIGWVIYRSIYSATIYTYFAPKSATVTIGDKSGRFGDNYVKPGQYTVRITKQGFTSYTQEVTVTKGETVRVEGSLTPSSDATASWYDDHLDDYKIAQEIADRKADEASARMLRDYPLIKKLPIIGPYESYRIDYGVSPNGGEGKYIIIIRSQSEEAKQQALLAIRATGYDIDKYEVEYRSNALTDGTTTFQNTVALTDRGITRRALDRIKAVLSPNYPGATILFANDASHAIQDDGATHIYTVSFSVNSEGSYRLTATVRNFSTIEVKVGNELLYNDTI